MNLKFYPLQLDPNRTDRAAKAPMRLMSTHAAKRMTFLGSNRSELESLCGMAVSEHGNEEEIPVGSWVTCILCQRILRKMQAKVLTDELDDILDD
jgi:hypothetical protein